MCKQSRKAVLALLALLAVMLGSHLDSKPALADGMILPGETAPDYLIVHYHHVTAHIEDQHAVTRVEQEFYNPYLYPITAQYLFPIPPEAILSNFQASVDGEQQDIAYQRPDETNAALYTIVAGRQDPSLLQYVDWESIHFELDLPAGGSRRMILEYEQVLQPNGGMYRYRYVLSTERYSAQSLEQVSLTIDLESSNGLSSIYSPSHPVTIERMGSHRARITWQANNVLPQEDLELFFSPTEGGFGSGLLHGRHNGQDHFLFLFSPEIESSRTHVLPKDIVLVFDRSGSMSGEKIEQARGALHYVLDQLDPNDRFSIVSFDDQLSLLAPTLQPASGDVLAEARRYVDALTPGGMTDLNAALQQGLEVLARSESRPGATRILLFLTDGLPTTGVTDEHLIAGNAAKTNAGLEARLHVFGLGYDVNTHLLDALSSDSGGSTTYVQPRENLEAVLSGFYDRIAHPAMTDLTIEFQGMEVEALYPQQLPDLFHGGSLLLAGRYHASANTVYVRVQGRAGEELKTYSYRFELDPADEQVFVPRLWATRRVGALLDQVRLEGENEELVAEIRELGLNYGLVTPYTTFIIEAQANGAASAENMQLYQQAELNQAWGQTTVQARVQNQMYQQAGQANLASGANVLHNGPANQVQLAGQNLDLALLQGKEVDGPISDDWIARNISVDRTVAFASEEYFALAGDPDVRPKLQGGANVIFEHEGTVIAVQTAGQSWDNAANTGNVWRNLLLNSRFFDFLQQLADLG